jgi:hypothetical protein
VIRSQSIPRVRTGARWQYTAEFAGLVKPLGMDAFETRRQVEVEQAAEGKRNFAPPAAIDVLLFNGHGCCVEEYAFDHDGGFRR